MAVRSFEWGAALAAFLLAGCATQTPAPPPVAVAAPLPAARVEVLARSDDFVVVMPRADDDFAALAERYLGDARRAWWIAEFNGVSRPARGVEVVIPLKAAILNRVGAGSVRTLTVLCYHRFDDVARSKLTVSAADFAAQMEFLAAHGYHVVALKDVPAILRGDAPMPPKAVAITIDDGYRSTYDIAFPVLFRHRFPATVFLYTDFAGLPAAMNWSHLKHMTDSGLIDVQPHSKTHANLALRGADESDRAYVERLRREIDFPGAEIERRLGKAIYAFAYPYGDASEIVAEQVRRGGIEIALTVSPGGNPVYSYPLLLRRTMVFGDQGIDEFRAKLAAQSLNGVD
jgi:peptidoglycan/xylan/chitin deacetylase (PgdA/CDA1 family)